MPAGTLLESHLAAGAGGCLGGAQIAVIQLLKDILTAFVTSPTVSGRLDPDALTPAICPSVRLSGCAWKRANGVYEVD